jgi:hypothetical protein
VQLSQLPRRSTTTNHCRLLNALQRQTKKELQAAAVWLASSYNTLTAAEEPPAAELHGQAAECGRRCGRPVRRYGS